MNDWFAPADWTRPEDYPGPGASLHALAWEFLRRNAEFRVACAAAKSDADWLRIQNDFSVTLWPPWVMIAAPPRMRLPRSPTDHGQVNGLHFLGTVEFDLRFPLQPQLKSARRLLEAQARFFDIPDNLTRQRGRRTDYVALLRILDGRAAGATFRAIASVLWPRQEPISAADRARKAHAEALELVAGGYRALPLIGPERKRAR